METLTTTDTSQQESDRFLHSPKVQQNVGSSEIRAAHAENVSLRTRIVEVDSERLNGEQPIHFGVAEPVGREPKSVIIMPVSWSDSASNPFQAQRSDLMAQVTGSRVVTLDFPGMGDHKHRRNEFTEVDLESIKEGRLDALAKSYWQAFEQDDVANGLLTSEQGDRLPMALWLNSLSTLTGSELLNAAPERTIFSDVYLSESMALRRMHTAELMARFVTGGGRSIVDYNKSNVGARIGSAKVPLKRQVSLQLQSHMAAVQALAGGRQIDVLDSAIKKQTSAITPDTLFHVVRAGEGLVEPEDNNRLIQFLEYALRQRFGHEPTLRIEELHGEGHGIQDSLPATQALVQDLSIVEKTT